MLIWIITDNSRKQISLLTDELSHFSTFIKLLKVGDKRSCLHKMLQATVDKKNKVPEMLAQAFYQDMEKLLSKLCSPNHNNLKVNKFMEWVESEGLIGIPRQFCNIKTLQHCICNIIIICN